MALVEIKTVDEMETALFFGKFKIFKIEIVENCSNDRRDRFAKVYFKDSDEIDEEYSVLTRYIEYTRSAEDIYSDFAKSYVFLEDGKELSREGLKNIISSIVR